jgi:exodeoxyribonuclease V gamma subunit
VLYTGADPVSGALRPPAVPVGELLDVIDAMVPGGRDDVVTRHPLQPYDVRSFTGTPPPSFDPVSLAGARRSVQPRAPEPERRPLGPRPGPVALDDLVAFVEHPVKAYLRQRLRITLPGEDDEVADALATSLDGLQEWAVGERMLAAGLRGTAAEDARRAEWLRGTLPPGSLGNDVLAKVERRVGALVAAGRPVLAATPRTVDVRLEIDGRELSGTVNGVRDGAVVSVTYSSLSARHRARAWVLALALAAAEGQGRAVTVGRMGNRARTSTLTAPPDPVAALADLIDLYERGMCEPLPLAVKSSWAYAGGRLGGNSAEQALESARTEWDRKQGGERDDRHHAHVWGDGASFDRLLGAAPGDGEEWAGETTRFGALACRLWAPVRTAEQFS